MTIKNPFLIFMIFLFFFCNPSFGQQFEIKENYFSPESFENKIFNAISCTDLGNYVDSFDTNGMITYKNDGWIYTYGYDSTGNLTYAYSKEPNSDSWDSDRSGSNYSYDKYGNVSAIDEYLMFADESHYSTEIYNYTYKDSLLVSCKKYFSNLSYNSMEIGASDDTVKSFYYYDSFQRIVKEEESHTSYPDKNRIFQYAFNDKNQLISIKEYIPNDTSLAGSIVYSYDSEGNIISRKKTGKKSYNENYKYINSMMIEKEIIENDVLDSERRIYKYTYDNFGNVLTKNEYSLNGTLIWRTVDRKYKYKNK
jgi:hypothetical protein